MEDPLEELKQQLGSTTIEVAESWEHLEDAKGFLKSHGYVEQDPQHQEEVTDDCLLFSLESPPMLQSAEECFKFPEKTPEPQYESSAKIPRFGAWPASVPSNSTTGSGRPEWNKCKDALRGRPEWRKVAAFQLDTVNLPNEDKLKIIAETPVESVEQTVQIKMVAQPEVLSDNANFSVSLKVETLVIGVNKEEFFNFKDQDLGIGFYPYCVQLDIEPLVDDGSVPLCAIPVFVHNAEQPRDPTSLTTFRNSKSIEAKVGYGPSKVKVDQKSEDTKVRLAPTGMEVEEVHEADGGNTASLRWKILQWKNNDTYETYDARRPERGLGGLKWLTSSSISRELPFKGGYAVKVPELPTVHWKLPKELNEERVSFKISLNVEMHLVWWKKSKVFRSARSIIYKGPSYTNVWKLKTRGERWWWR